MSQLPRIPSASPREVPAVEAKTFPDWFMSSLVINSTPGGESKCSVSLVPFNYDTGDASADVVRIEFSDLRATATERALAGKVELAQALSAVLLAVAQVASEIDTEMSVIEINPSEG